MEQIPQNNETDTEIIEKTKQDLIEEYDESFQGEVRDELGKLEKKDREQFEARMEEIIAQKKQVIDELLQAWVKDPEQIEKWKPKFNKVSLSALRDSLKNIQDYNDETIIEEDGIAA